MASAWESQSLNLYDDIRNFMLYPTINLQLLTGFDTNTIFLLRTLGIKKLYIMNKQFQVEHLAAIGTLTLHCVRCGNKCELLLQACRLDGGRRHLHFCRLNPFPV